MRQLFDTLIPAGSQLRDLAEEICCLSPNLFHTGNHPPFNFLANSELGAAWHPPQYSPSDIAIWKSNYVDRPLLPAENNGFIYQSPTRRGLAMIFDPLVDAFIGAHLKSSSSIPSGCTIIVLSDYFPLHLSVSSSTCGDWSSCESTQVLQGNVNDPTTTRLFNTLFGSGWKGQASRISAEICRQKLLVWNFLPMFRGGNSAMGLTGLPTSPHWQALCWPFLWNFAAAVGASRIILACSKICLKASSTGPGNIITSSKPHSGPPLFPSPPKCVTKVYRINHPYSWIGNTDAASLKSILSGDPCS